MKIRYAVWIPGLMMLIACRVQGVAPAAPATSANALLLNLKQNVQTADQLIQSARKQLKTLTRLQEDCEREKKQQRKTGRLVAGEAREFKAVQKKIKVFKVRLTQLEKRIAVAVEETQRWETIQSEYEKIKSQRQEAKARLQGIIRARKDGEKAAADLKKKAAAIEKRLKRISKPAGSIESLQAAIEKQKQLRSESDAAFQRHEASCAAMEKAIAGLTLKLAKAQARENEIQRHDKTITRLKADVQREKKQQAKSMTEAEQATISAEEAEKELLQLKMKWNEVEKRVAAGVPQLQAVKQMRVELENVKTQRLTSEAGIQQAARVRATAVKSIADLKRQIADAEKQASLKRRRQNSDIESLRKKLEKEKKLQVEAATAMNRQSEAHAAMEKEIADWNVKLADIRKRQADAGSGTNVIISQLQAELKQARQSRVAVEARLDNERQALKTAGKTLDDVRREWKTLEKQSVRTHKQAGAVKEIQSDLDKEKKLRTETEVEVKQHVIRRTALEKEMAELKVKLAEAGQQQAGARQQAASFDQLQSELDREIKMKKAAQANVKREASAVSDAEKKLKKIRAQHVKTQKQSVELNRQLERLDQLQAELKKAEQARRNAEAGVKTAVETRAAAEKEMKQMKSRLALLEKQTAKKEAQVRKLAPLQADLEKAKRKTQEALARTNVPRDEIQQKIQALQVRLTNAEKRYAKKTEQVKAAEAIRDQLAREKHLQASADKRARGLNREWKRLESRASDLAASLRVMEGRIAKAERMLQPAGRVKLELEKARQAHQQTVAKIQADTNAQACLEARLTSLAGKTESMSDLLDTMNQQIKSSRHAQSDLVRERNERESAEAAARKDLERQLKTLGETVADLNDKLSREPARKPVILSRAEQGEAVEALPRDRAAQTEASGETNVLAAEQRIVAEARRSGDLRTKKQAQAELHYQSGIRKWDKGDIGGAIVEFKKTVFLNPDAAGAYYNLGLAYLRNDNTSRACSYAYQAGRIYLKEKNIRQARRMVVFLKSMDSSSRLIDKLRKEINRQSK